MLILKALVRTDLGEKYFDRKYRIHKYEYDLNEISKTYRLGLYAYEANLSVKYYLFDVLILFFTVSHIICLMLQGLYRKRETEIENVLEASERIITNTILIDRSTLRRRRSQDESFFQRQDTLRKEMEQQENMKFNDTRSNMVSGREIDLKKLLNTSEQRGINLSKFSKKNKLQIKPGYDMYNYIASSQFLIILYTILFFNLVERDYSNRAPENYTLQQFSANTVIVVFLMILVV